jgi:hypothetical protein
MNGFVGFVGRRSSSADGRRRMGTRFSWFRRYGRMIIINYWAELSSLPSIFLPEERLAFGAEISDASYNGLRLLIELVIDSCASA